MLRKVNLSIVLAILGLIVFVPAAKAGFGISPPYVKTQKPIFPGSHYEQQIMLLRSAADEELQAEIKVNAPEIASWISIAQGDVFDLPSDQLRVPMIVQVDVPETAEIGDYKGHINVRIVPKNKHQSGVAIALGARIDVDLVVTNEEFIDFKVKQIQVPDIETLKKPWNWKMFSYFFYRTKVIMRIENTGNTKVAPSKVVMEVTDLNEKQVLEAYEDTSLKEVEPFVTQEITASFPTNLEVGHYWSNIKVYKDNNIIRKDKVAFAVVPNGTLGTKLGIWPWIMVSGIFLVIAIIVFVLVKIKIWRYIFLVILFITWPIRFIWKKLLKLWSALKIKFWRWMHRKSASYQNMPESSKEEKNEVEK